MFWKFEISVCKSELCGKKGDLFTLLMEMLFWGLRQPLIWQRLIQSSMFWFLFLQHLPNTDPWMASLPFSLQWRYLNPTSYSLDYADAFTSSLVLQDLMYLCIQNFLRLTLQGSYCRCDELYFPCYSTLKINGDMLSYTRPRCYSMQYSVLWDTFEYF